MIYADNRELWNTLKTLLGITDSDVMAFQLNIGMDEIPTVKITRRITGLPSLATTTQKYLIKPITGVDIDLCENVVPPLMVNGVPVSDVTHLGSEHREYRHEPT